MEHAKKMMLVEPRVLEELQARNEYKELVKDPSIKRKAKASEVVRNTLDDEEMADDIKAKLYQQEFSRFMNVRNKIPEEPKRRRPINITKLPRLQIEEEEEELIPQREGRH